MRIVITGAKGMLGQALLYALGRGHQVTPLGHSDLDVTDLAATRELIRGCSPDVVIHAAAWTDVDGCEDGRDRAFQVNALGSRNVAAACREVDASCCYISTDYVFDGGSPTAYTEFDSPNPISVYGASKLEGERAVRSLLPAHWVVRSSWLFGPGGKNFVKTILAKARSSQPLRVVDDQKGSPTYTIDLAEGIARLIREPRYGVWHLTNSGSCSWYEFACAALSQAGLLSPGAIGAIDSTALGRPAPRPKNSVLRNYCWELEGWPPLRPWQQALHDYLGHPELA